MGKCGCHEMLIQPCITVLFFSSFFSVSDTTMALVVELLESFISAYQYSVGIHQIRIFGFDVFGFERFGFEKIRLRMNSNSDGFERIRFRTNLDSKRFEFEKVRIRIDLGSLMFEIRLDSLSKTTNSRMLKRSRQLCISSRTFTYIS